MILAAGLGTRLRPLTNTVPKPLLPVLGTPLIVWNLLLLKRHGFRDVIINLHHLAPMIEQALGNGSRFGLRIFYSHEPIILGTGGGIKQVTEGTVDFGASDGPMNEQQLKDFQQKRGCGILHLPTVLGVQTDNLGVIEAAFFREANLPLLVEEHKLSNRYDQIVGAQTVEWDGKEVTISQLRPVLLDTDPSRREKAWRLSLRRQLADRQPLNELWQTFLTLRRQLAANAGLQSFRDFRWQQLLRFDYTPADCLRFHQAIETAVVPAAKSLPRFSA